MREIRVSVVETAAKVKLIFLKSTKGRLTSKLEIEILQQIRMLNLSWVYTNYKLMIGRNSQTIIVIKSGMNNNRV